MPPASLLLLLLSLLALAALLPHANASSDPIWPKVLPPSLPPYLRERAG